VKYMTEQEQRQAARIAELERAIMDAMMHLETNYDIDGQCMSESDAMDCLRSATRTPATAPEGGSDE
jgi:hypothetical protein